MSQWEYLWRKTYWVEASRSGDYVEWLTYKHVWKPDRQTESPFPNNDGLDQLGSDGWELVATMPEPTAYVTRISPQQGESVTNFTCWTLVFKRPLAKSPEQAPSIGVNYRR